MGLISEAQDARVRAVGDGGRRRVVRRPGRDERERDRDKLHANLITYESTDRSRVVSG